MTARNEQETTVSAGRDDEWVFVWTNNPVHARRLDTDAVDWAEGDVLPNFTHQRVGDDEVFVFCPFCQVDYDGMALVVATLTDDDLMRRRSSYLHQQVDFDATPRIERGLQVTTDEARRRGLYGYGDTTTDPT